MNLTAREMNRLTQLCQKAGVVVIRPMLKELMVIQADGETMAELTEKVKSYGFRDRKNHPLENCSEFIEMAKKSAAFDEICRIMKETPGCSIKDRDRARCDGIWGVMQQVKP